MEDLSMLKLIVSDYDRFCCIAEKLEWIDIKEQYEDWHDCEFGICLDIFEFPEGYIQKNMLQAYVRTVLSGMAFYEEWEKDFWKISESERKECLTKGRALYEAYAIPKEVRFIRRDWQYFVKEIEFFANRNQIPVSKQRAYINKFENAEVIEIGGCYSSDYEYLVMKDNLISIASCGIWD